MSYLEILATVSVSGFISFSDHAIPNAPLKHHNITTAYFCTVSILVIHYLPQCRTMYHLYGYGILVFNRISPTFVYMIADKCFKRIDKSFNSIILPYLKS